MEFLHIYALDFGENQHKKLTPKNLTPKGVATRIFTWAV